MLYRVSGNVGGAVINFAPASEAEEIAQNIRTLIMTLKYSAPLDRALGVDASFLDRPAPDAMARLRVQIFEEIRRHEPRANTKSIEFKRYDAGAMSGAFYPIVHAEIGAEGRVA